MPVNAIKLSREDAIGVHAPAPGVAARIEGCLLLGAGIVGSLGVALPHPPQTNTTGLLALQLTTFAGAIVMLALGDRAPRWLVNAAPFAATALTSLAVALAGHSTTPYVLFYLWVGFYAFYFLPRRDSVRLVAFLLLNYLLVIVGFRISRPAAPLDPAGADVFAFLITAASVAVAGVFILRLRDRMRRLIEQLTDAASTDSLTGLLNRRGFQRTIDLELARCERAGRRFSLLLGDCDFFKHLNDRLGHHAGDRALESIGALLERNRRRIDTAARIGGEEFALVLAETDQAEAYLVAERLRNRFREVFSGDPVPLTMSFGVATYPDHGRTADELLKAADEGLYAAKTLGRDRTVIHSAEVAGILSAALSGNGVRDHAQLATVLSLAEALDIRDTGTARHSQTVGRLCELMAEGLGLSRARIARVRLAGVLHDIGKIGVPDAILGKPGQLSDEEWRQMRKHPEIAARILGGSGFDDIRGWILAHHERLDGRGYPAGLPGEKIPLEARIVAVADAYEAMTSDRVYRPSIGMAAACRELRRGAGTQFDARVVEALLKALPVDGAAIPAPSASGTRTRVR